ncbi:MAG: hypothetical protein EBX50_06520 [Chitinophagia bacterium]|nr:hypothetical protein [Chitinophagia bacterium]
MEAEEGCSKWEIPKFIWLLAFARMHLPAISLVNRMQSCFLICWQDAKIKTVNRKKTYFFIAVIVL